MPGGGSTWLVGSEVPTLALPLPRLAIFANLALLSSSLGLLIPRLSAIGSAKIKGIESVTKPNRKLTASALGMTSSPTLNPNPPSGALTLGRVEPSNNQIEVLVGYARSPRLGGRSGRRGVITRGGHRHPSSL